MIDKMQPVFSAQGVNVFYGKKQALRNVNVEILRNQVTAMIGPSGCGKSTFLRCLNRMNDQILGCRVTGDIFFNGENIHAPSVDTGILRKRVGMVFQKANPFPRSIYDNVAYGPRIHDLVAYGIPRALDDIVFSNLERVGLLEEVRDRLHDSAFGLSGGQQQRLCIARAIAIEPEVLLMDEPCSALDPNASEQVEQLIGELRQNYSIIIVTHSMQQAGRISQRTAFFHLGDLIEEGETDEIFSSPKDERTQAYLAGIIG